MLKALGRMNPTNVAYIGLLLVFVALGTFVYALAVGSELAGVIGGSLILLAIATVVGFRVGARKRAESNDSGITIEGANVWAHPMRRQQIDRYLQTYRGTREGHARMWQAATVIDEHTEDRRAA